MRSIDDGWLRFLTELEDDCPACHGTGRTANARWRAWHQRAHELIAVAEAAHRANELTPVPHTTPDGPAIVTAVERAIEDHMRARPADPEETPCGTCHGIGRQLTPAGRMFTDLLTRHGFIRNA
ncbi:hypothetical protein D0T12_23935 [Actinomadura spongiicola]|uniref:Uncharacterized protein n=1 Tax=Actinomadura spongiicola TaxID=2303421 RepID=A0A372GCT9_9ACTN|nr:hypothetical protein [Actinomadura spongiicola]RFS83206.1 hypothetical protein D0T12_23935 [Actinomadura spongiicola]